jgi:hypothetical protein
MIAESIEDFTHCLGFGCPLAKTCVRYKAAPDAGDKFFRGVPFSDDGGFIECVRWVDKKDTYNSLMRRINEK